ncbi:hypothetical protein FC85_GL002408 [Lentilactobacillus diolivorans DSM 14421]|uniref:DUF5776 domain-containing protein n=2 Tax=Lentilactobacillus diolivorans TaxID=179838 RepID=A0A0R1SH45_9LACO|nr:hypothetical protein FC85_GL002408 [Lentilactobacillus diolivorans DSM 14421]
MLVGLASGLMLGGMYLEIGVPMLDQSVTAKAATTFNLKDIDWMSSWTADVNGMPTTASYGLNNPTLPSGLTPYDSILLPQSNYDNNSIKSPIKIPLGTQMNFYGQIGSEYGFMQKYATGIQMGIGSKTINALEAIKEGLGVATDADLGKLFTVNVSEITPTGVTVANDKLQDTKNPVGTIVGLDQLKDPNDLVKVTISPKDTTYLTGDPLTYYFGAPVNYSYKFDNGTEQIVSADNSAAITVPKGTKVAVLKADGYQTSQWSSSDSSVKVDKDGNVTGLDNPSLNGKTVKVTVSDADNPTGRTYTFNLAIGTPAVTPGGGSGSGTAVTPGTDSSSTNISTTTGSSSATLPTTTTSQKQGATTSTDTVPMNNSANVPSNTAVKGEVVYSTKNIGLYKSTDFKKSQRLAWYPKQMRANRPMFRVTGYKRAANGVLRYKVRDVNHGRKTAGRTGYITASPKYVVSVYYASVPKSKKVTVISPNGVTAYKTAGLTGKVKHYKKGVRLTVKKLVKHNLTTRYQLSNGHFVTANKKLVIAGNH